MKYYPIALGFFCLSICACKKNNTSISVTIPRLPASFTGMKTWRSATAPSSSQRYQFEVTTQGKDTVTVEGRGLYYQSTGTTNTGYTLKYGAGLPGGTVHATFIHSTDGDTIYYGWEHSDLGGHTVIASYVTP